MNKLFIINLVLIFSLISIFIYADTNGVWHRAEDIRAGIFGSDEGGGDFGFTNNVNIANNLQVATINGGIPITSLNIRSQHVAISDIAYKLNSPATDNFANEITVNKIRVGNSIIFPDGVVIGSGSVGGGGGTSLPVGTSCEMELSGLYPHNINCADPLLCSLSNPLQSMISCINYNGGAKVQCKNSGVIQSNGKCGVYFPTLSRVMYDGEDIAFGKSTPTSEVNIDYSQCSMIQPGNKIGPHLTYCPNGYVTVGGWSDGNDWVPEGQICCKIGVGINWDSRPQPPGHIIQ